MLGEIGQDLIDKFGIDLLPVEPEAIAFKFLPNRDYKSWTLFDGTEVAVPGGFEVEVTDDGYWLLHEDCDSMKPVVARMPKDGYYFDRSDITSLDPKFHLLILRN
jgi:hypothetical protein